MKRVIVKLLNLSKWPNFFFFILRLNYSHQKPFFHLDLLTSSDAPSLLLGHGLYFIRNAIQKLTNRFWSLFSGKNHDFSYKTLNNWILKFNCIRPHHVFSEYFFLIRLIGINLYIVHCVICMRGKLYWSALPPSWWWWTSKFPIISIQVLQKRIAFHF